METSEDRSKETVHVLGLLVSQYEKVLGSWEEVYRATILSCCCPIAKRFDIVGELCAMSFGFLVVLLSSSHVISEKVIHVIIGARVIGCSNSATVGGTVVSQARSLAALLLSSCVIP